MSLTEDGFSALIETSRIIKANHLENGEFNRVDVVVRAMYVDAKITNSPDIKAYGGLYCKMQRKRIRGLRKKTYQQLISKFDRLIESIQAHGLGREKFAKLKFFVCLGRDSLILRDGSHRLAVAVALGIDIVPVSFKCKRKPKRAGQGGYGLRWFKRRGFTKEEMRLIEQGMKKFIS